MAARNKAVKVSNFRQPASVDDVHLLDAVSTLIRGIGEDVNREGLQKTPSRVVKALFEMTAGYRQNPKEILSAHFNAEKYDQMVILRDIEFTSMCEHHMLPFRGVVHIGYIPKDRIVGLSKLARLAECFAKRLQVQERMTQEIARSFNQIVRPLGVGVVIEAHHQCMSCRGIQKNNTIMVTSALLGDMRKAEVRAEFLEMIKK